MSKRSSIFNTIRTEGAILPAELLQRIVSGDTTLEGLKSTDYHLSPSERLNEAATRSWNRLIGVWQTYKEILNQLPEEAIGTTETRERWLLPLFQELGYGRLQTQKSIEIEDKTYPISHKASEPVAIHLVSFKWDLDKRNPIAKGETKLSPHSLMQEFLNRSEDHLWGILSNGLKLRILRDNVSLTRAAYVEFDLQAMMDGLAYSDFFLLYLLCHQSRVEVKTDETGRALPPETCWLEKWYNASIKDGVRALDELRNNVQSAIESLGAGFLSHPANTELRDKLRSGNLSLQDYYHQVLLQVYRLLFVFVAEDRDLLIPGDVSEMVKQTYHKYYSTYRIRELARKKRGTRHSDLWQQLNLLFNGLYDGNTALGLPALGSFLFKVRGSEIASLRDTTSLSGHLTTSPSSTPDLDFCSIANSDLLSAVRFLCYTQKNNIFQPINYRNLGPEELGSVYESLLEMHPEINLEAAYFKLNVISGSERKTTGSYYTPSSLVNCLLDSALEPVIEAALKGRDTTSPSGHLTTSPSGHLTTSPEKALLALKICDPACGSGHFLISAAHRLAKRLASIRAGEDEPAPSVVQHALRDVIGHCIYGVDINPMSVELCKISLWMEALEPGKPLTFLDHHIQCGNSLLGCTPALLKKGIPDAAFDHNTGDDKAVCSRFKKLNKDESKGNIDIFSSEREDWLSKRGLQSGIRALNQIADDDLNGLQAKERSYADFVQSQDYQNTKLIYDAWCAAFVWIKDGDPQRPEPITYGIMESIKSDPENVAPLLRQEIMRLAEEYNFFHWHIAFPDVFPLTTSPSGHLTTSPNSGFDCILGNPPWEHNELKEKEWFAGRDVEISEADGAKRKKLIANLEKENPAMYNKYLRDLRYYQATSMMYNKEAGLYPLCGRGRINTYTIFAELNRKLLSKSGYCGCIVPSGIATDDTTKFFFQDLTDTGSLVSLYDFENREGIFPGVHRSYKFCLLTLRAPQTTGHLPLTTHHSPADFVFFAHAIADLSDEQRHFQLSAADIALINPNTRTCPIFRSKQDAELTKYIYRRVPVLINENDSVNGNPWGISFKQGLFNMTSDSHLFKTKQQLEEKGFELQGNHFVKGEERYLPLYEGKMVQNYDHRAADVRISEEALQRKGQPDELSIEEHIYPYRLAMPSSWIAYKDFINALSNDKQARWFLGFSSVTSPTNARSYIPCLIPQSGVGNSFPVMISTSADAVLISKLYACMSSYILDYNARQKIGGVNLNFFLVNQFPVLDVELVGNYQKSITDWLKQYVIARVLELSYTAWDMQPFAIDCGYDGPPFIWDEERRFEIKCELDALYFHLYLGTLSDWQTQGTPELLSYLPTPRHAVEYIMETFPIVKRKDEKEYGQYRTKLRILEIYDAMTPLFETTLLQASATTTSPSGHLAISPLDPPPGPLCDENGNFIPVEQWDKNNWPKHIHKRNGSK